MEVEMPDDWWKWGEPGKRKSLAAYPKLKAHLENAWGIALNDVKSSGTKLNIQQHQEQVALIQNIFAKFQPALELSIRVKKSIGKSFPDYINIRNQNPLRIVDGVLHPENHDEVLEILTLAATANVAVVPVGGGTNVVGALELSATLQRPCVALDFSKMNEALLFDEVNCKAILQAGITGPQVEEALNQRGYTLSHFPQSFQYSTLGGWVATNSAGQESSAYGRIQDVVIALKVATPQGTITTSPQPADADGINLKSLFFGSEGKLGVVTEATVRIKRLPLNKNWAIGLFPKYADGLKALRLLVQKKGMPSVVRYCDEEETFFLSLLSEKQDTIFSKVKSLFQKAVLKWWGINKPCLMMLRFEDECASDCSLSSEAKRLFEKHGAMLLDESTGHKWESSRFNLPYLRDDLMERSIVVDSMETVLPWNKIEELRLALKQALSNCNAFNGSKGVVLTHVSHVYTSAACVYFTVLTPLHTDNAIMQWQQIKTMVTETILKHGGAVSHHHGVGKLHKQWQQQDALTQKIISSIKHTVDPANILNPGR